MKAYFINELGPVLERADILSFRDVDIPLPGKNEVLIKVSTCGICHTELDEIEGRSAPPELPVIPGHQVVGRIEKIPENLHGFNIGDRIGVGWIYSSCENCDFCKSGLPNLCDHFRATGRDKNGGYAEYMTAHKDYIYHIPNSFSDEEAAPLLCAGAIGYRSLKLAQLKDGQNLGLTGFGASGHLVLKLSRYLFPNSAVYVFARSEKEREFAREFGALWAGDTSDFPPEKLHAIIDTTPVWKPIIEGLKHLNKGGRFIINAIRKEGHDKNELLTLSYEDQLWMEKEIKSVANITPKDVSEFLDIASKMKLKPEIQVYPFENANKALRELKEGQIRGAKVLKIG